MKALRHTACVLLAAASFFSLPATAASYSTDQSDLWYIPAESGWGIQFVQRGDVIFATIFVYGPNSAPTWYTATLTPTPPGSLVWSGDLAATTGPWFGTVPYDKTQVTIRKAGTMTWTPATVTTGTLTYSVDGVQVTKSIVRQTLVNENYAGHFGGAIHEVDSACPNAGFNGTYENLGIVDVTQSGTTVTLTASPLSGPSCTYSGTLTQHGQMGEVVGAYACSDGQAGNFDIFEFQVTEFSVTGRFAASYTSGPRAGCQGSGYFGGLKATTI